MQSRITLESPRIDGDTLELAATYFPGDQPQRSHRLWWRLPAQWQDSVTTSADPFVVAFLFCMMQSAAAGAREAVIEAPVSPSLLQNLETFMAVWHAWMPEVYRPVKIIAAQEIEAPPPALPGETIMPFSCGVDSAFTAFRHHQKILGRRNKNIRAAVVMHGFDIWLDQPHSGAIYKGLLESARTMLQSLDIACIPVANNFHELPTTWGDSHGAHLAAALHLFSRRFDTALVPNSVIYSALDKPWGSHPLTDPLLSSRRFQIVDDGGEFTRYQKIPLLAQWPEGLQNLRVCFGNAEATHHNCCRCEKCLYTILTFRVAGFPQPPAFRIPLTDRRIARLRIDKNLLTAGWARLSAAIVQKQLQHTSWARAIRTARRRSSIRNFFKDVNRPFIPLRNAVRKIFRGSALSRKKIAQSQSAGPTVLPRSATEE